MQRRTHIWVIQRSQSPWLWSWDTYTGRKKKKKNEQTRRPQKLTLDENCLANSLTEGIAQCCASSANSDENEFFRPPPTPPTPPPPLSRRSDQEHTRTSLSCRRPPPTPVVESPAGRRTIGDSGPSPSSACRRPWSSSPICTTSLVTFFWYITDTHTNDIPYTCFRFEYIFTRTIHNNNITRRHCKCTRGCWYDRGVLRIFPRRGSPKFFQQFINGKEKKKRFASVNNNKHTCCIVNWLSRTVHVHSNEYLSTNKMS